MTTVEFHLLFEGIAVGVAIAWLASRLLERRRRRDQPPERGSYWRDPDVAAATRKMLAERDAEVLRSAGRQAPRVPSRAGRQLDEE